LAFQLAASGRTVAPKPLLLTFKIGQLYETAAAYEIQLVGAGFIDTLKRSSAAFL
jgi:hypothetical protein